MQDRDYAPLLKHLDAWFHNRKWEVFDFQRACWNAVLEGNDGLLNAPTGSGKTLAMWLPFAVKALSEHNQRTKPAIRLLWITPLRALARDTELALQQSARELGVSWQVARRTGDSSAADKARMRKSPPEVLITTPETLHLLLSQADYPTLFSRLDGIIVDEWHELMGTKRGVQTELAIAHLRAMRPALQLWGISATIGNMEESARTLGLKPAAVVIKADIQKNIAVHTLLPEHIDQFPWAGHIGLKLAPRVAEIVRESTTTLLFTNTRSMTEIWYQHLLDAAPDLAGRMAIHHSSLSQDIRNWVEKALHDGELQLVICTSSLDLGVDFAPVETVIQVGSPKGVARFMQRAGRSGHQPGATSTIYFLPTHALEILDSVALQRAMKTDQIESRPALHKPLDVLLQFICTLATGAGCEPEELFNQLRGTHTYRELTSEELNWAVAFLTNGGSVLQHYEEYSRVKRAENGTLHIVDRRTAMRHRLSIGTILSDTSLSVRFVKGGRIGSVEESFIARLKPGDIFLFAGRYLEFVRLKDLTVYVRKSGATKGAVSRWMGGRMQLSSQLAHHIRVLLQEISESDHIHLDTELQAMIPLLHKQSERSHLPTQQELLIEQIRTREGWHHFVFPLDGRAVHEGLSSLIAWRIGQKMPISFSIAMNDYGFELLSDQPVPPELFHEPDLFRTEDLEHDIRSAINASEMAKRHFREIARIAGLIFQGYPGKKLQNRHLQANSGLLFDVFEKYEPENRLILQSYAEIMQSQIETQRLANTLERIRNGTIIITNPERFTPFSFPIMVDRLRSKLSSEKLEDRIRKMYTKLTAD
ncbi:MAG: ligase-associated DNA damage response DEXH box helicase [Bacteroidetes bacterium]|nr:ligase-associated DNA damage response DEXH box helicase [Bacteroidota bacterium]MCH8524450.1 ligase-associated DNA damage response DEXH box helicase [Balneolales bacterium]